MGLSMVITSAIQDSGLQLPEFQILSCKSEKIGLGIDKSAWKKKQRKPTSDPPIVLEHYIYFVIVVTLSRLFVQLDPRDDNCHDFCCRHRARNSEGHGHARR